MYRGTSRYSVLQSWKRQMADRVFRLVRRAQGRDREGFWRDKTDVGIEPGLEELFWEKGYEREWEKTDERAERDKKRKMYCFVQWKENKRVNELALLYNIRLRKIILYLMVDKTKSLS